jgi:Tol biopolymer transport system component
MFRFMTRIQVDRWRLISATIAATALAASVVGRGAARGMPGHDTQGGVSVFHQDVSWAPASHRIAYSALRNGEWRLFVADVASGTSRQVTTGPAADQWTTWAPDNRHLAYASKPPNGQADIYAIDVDASGDPTRLTVTSGVRNTEPAWSPDGRQIAFVSKRDNEHQQVWLMNADGSNQHRATNLPVNVEAPNWSPDGRRLVFYTDAGDGKDQIWTATSDGSDPINVTHDAGHHIYPGWAGDDHVVFSTIDANDVPSPMIARFDGADRQPLVPQHAFFARLSPDGRQVALLIGKYPANAVTLCDRSGTACKVIQP